MTNVDLTRQAARTVAGMRALRRKSANVASQTIDFNLGNDA
jgi:hypothetical protein